MKMEKFLTFLCIRKHISKGDLYIAVTVFAVTVFYGMMDSEERERRLFKDEIYEEVLCIDP